MSSPSAASTPPAVQTIRKPVSPITSADQEREDGNAVLSQPSKLFYARLFAITVFAVLAWLLFQVMQPFISPLLWALFLAFLLYPLHVHLLRYTNGRKALSATLLIVATFIIITGPVAAMSANFASQAGELLHWLQLTLAKQAPQQYQALAEMPLIGSLLIWLQQNFDVDALQVQQWLSQLADQAPPVLADLSKRAFFGAFHTVFAFLVMLFMLFFFLRDGSEFTAMLRDLIPMPAARREQLMDHVAAVTRAVVFGICVTALIQGALVGIAFLITGLSAPLVFGVLAAVLALLPMGGTALVWVPAMLLLASQGYWGMAATMLTLGIVSSTVDNVLRPLLISGRGDVGTLAIFLGVLGGALAFGPIGFFLGPVLLALIIALIRFSLELHRDAGAQT